MLMSFDRNVYSQLELMLIRCLIGFTWISANLERILKWSGSNIPKAAVDNMGS